MKTNKKYFFQIVLFFLIISGLPGCAGLSQQYRASTQGIKIDYDVKKEATIDLLHSVSIKTLDTRNVGYVIGYGARNTAGNRLIGKIAFGAFYDFLPTNPFIKRDINPVSAFKVAMEERLKANGVKLERPKPTTINIELEIKRILLDFKSATWVADISYMARVKFKNKIICEQNITERETAFNLWGFGSGEEALNSAFNKAINKFNLTCIQETPL